MHQLFERQWAEISVPRQPAGQLQQLFEHTNPQPRPWMPLVGVLYDRHGTPLPLHQGNDCRNLIRELTTNHNWPFMATRFVDTPVIIWIDGPTLPHVKATAREVRQGEMQRTMHLHRMCSLTHLTDQTLQTTSPADLDSLDLRTLLSTSELVATIQKQVATHAWNSPTDPAAPLLADLTYNQFQGTFHRRSYPEPEVRNPTAGILHLLGNWHQPDRQHPQVLNQMLAATTAS